MTYACTPSLYVAPLEPLCTLIMCTLPPDPVHPELLHTPLAHTSTLSTAPPEPLHSASLDTALMEPPYKPLLCTPSLNTSPFEPPQSPSLDTAPPQSVLMPMQPFLAAPSEMLPTPLAPVRSRLACPCRPSCHPFSSSRVPFIPPDGDKFELSMWVGGTAVAKPRSMLSDVHPLPYQRRNQIYNY